MDLRKMLFNKGLKQVEVAKAIGWCPSAFNKFLNGWIGIPEKYKDRLCKQLEITPEQLQKGFQTGGGR